MIAADIQAMKMRLRNKAFTAATLVISMYFVSTGITHGQTEELSKTEGARVLEEIEVTARRRQESLQDAPVAVTALSQEYLENIGARSFADFATSVPGLSYVGNNSPENKIVLRGVSTGVASRDEGAVIGMYFDDVPVGSRRFNPDLRLFDIERIEVLRGPQGTLFGEGSIGGTLRYVPNKPDLESAALELDTSLSSTEKGGTNYSVAGVANVPIVEDTFGLRLVAYYVEDSGYVDNVTLNRNNVNETETVGFRAVTTLHFNEDVSASFSYLYQDSDTPGKAQYDPGLGDLKQARNFEEALADEFHLANLTLDWDLGGATLSSSTAYFDREVINLRDISPLLGGLPIFLDDLAGFESWVQEVRLTSNRGLFGGHLDWVLGVYYRDDEEIFIQDAGAEALGGDVLDADSTLDRKQIAVFGELDFNITHKLTATAGARWFDIEQDVVDLSGGLLAGLPGTIETIYSGADESGVSPKFRLSYDVNEEILVYGVASRGFREGGPTGQGVPADPVTGEPAPSQFDSDSLWNLEGGFKTSWGNNRLVFNGAGFYIDWKDIQTNFIRSDGHTFTINAGGARSVGAEFELRALPFAFADFEIFSTASYVNSELTDDQLPPGDGRSGDRIPGVPEVTFSAGFNYRRSMSPGLDGFINFNFQHVGSSYNGFTAATGTSGAGADRQKPYQLGNLRLGVETGKWELAFFANNIWDERAVLYFNRIVGDVRINTTRPRTLGVALKGKF